MLTDALSLHLPLDDVDGSTVADRSVNKNDSIVQNSVSGRVTRVWDATFGVCSHFDHSAVDVRDPFGDVPEFTLALWVRPEHAMAAGALVTTMPSHDAHGYGLFATDGGGLGYRTGASPTLTVATDFFPTAGGWTHVAWVSGTDGQRFYRDGVQVATADAVPAPGHVQIRIGSAGEEPWVGRMAHVRIWQRALSTAEVTEVIAADQVMPFRSSHPVGFRLEGPQGEQAIYVNEHPAAPRRPHTLTAQNASGRPVYFLPLNGGPDATNHHLRLRARRGVLSQATLTGLRLTGGAAGWQMSAADLSGDGVSFYFLQTGVPEPMADGAEVAFELSPFSADPTSGARSVRVELTTGALAYTSDAPGAERISETRTQLLSVVNHSGREHIPLHVGFVGASAVLNVAQERGKANDLHLRLTNTLVLDPAYPEHSDLVFAGSGSSTPQSAVVLSVVLEPRDQPGSVPWALASEGEIESVVIKPPPNWDMRDDHDGSSRRWTLTPQQTAVLRAGDHLDVIIEQVVTSLPAGRADLTVRWENVPGYWDDQTVVPIEKTPLVLRPDAVGVGTAEPQGFHVDLPENGDAHGALGVLLSGGRQGNARIELRNDGVGTPYIDFALGEGDYDGRIRLWEKERLMIEGAYLGINVVPTVQLDVNGALLVRGNIVSEGSEFALGKAVQETDGETGASRALAKEEGGMLTLNYESDFTGGVRINGPKIEMNGRVAVNDDISMNFEVSMHDKVLMYDKVAMRGKVAIGLPVQEDHQLTVQAISEHVQLRRPDGEVSGGNVLFLELFQPNSGGEEVYPSIRFHHSGTFWKRIEGRPDGIHFKEGYLGLDHYTSIYTAGLQIGGTIIREHELQILKRLAAGQLQFDLYNVVHSEYAYAAEYGARDDDRRSVFTWRHSNEHVGQGRWRIDSPE